jgi:hypothetical protein
MPLCIQEYATKYNLSIKEAFDHAWRDTFGRQCRCNQTRIDAERYERKRQKPDYVIGFEQRRSTAIIRARQRDLFVGG